MQRDIVLRWIAQLAAIIARLLRRDPKLSLELARQYLEEAEAQTLGPLGPLVAKLDAESAARLLDDPHRIYGYCQILALASALTRVEGRLEEAEALARRAVAMGRAAVDRAEDPPEEWSEWLERASRDLFEPPSELTSEASAPDSRSS
ncbi:MAG: hypothetical protein AB7R55_10800 [Gemmatimonadales bacterium]